MFARAKAIVARSWIGFVDAFVDGWMLEHFAVPWMGRHGGLRWRVCSVMAILVLAGVEGASSVRRACVEASRR